MATISKATHRIRRHARVRAKISGTSERPRVAVFKSNQHTYVQAIDDTRRLTIVGLSDAEVKPAGQGGRKEQKAYALGETLAKKLQEKRVTQVLFDRGGFKYHGRVKAVAEGLRKGGIKL